MEVVTGDSRNAGAAAANSLHGQGVLKKLRPLGTSGCPLNSVLRLPPIGRRFEQGNPFNKCLK
jgi:hypothetical protein